MPTIRDIAKNAGVSTATVSRVFSAADAVQPETRERVLRVARELNYKPRAAARNLRRAAGPAGELRYVLGVLFFGGAVFSEDPFTVELTACVERALRERGFSMRIIACHRGGGVPDEILQGEIDGVICRSAGRLVRDIGALLPTVTIDYFDPALEVYGVVPDYRSGVRALARRMIRAGHRRIAVLAGIPPADSPELGFSRQVHLGCREAARACQVGDETFRFLAGASNPAQGYALAREILAAADPPDAIVGSDGAMLGIYRAAHERGLRIPDDLACAGIDGLAQSEYLSPPLTAVHVNLPMVASKAVNYLVDAATRGERRRGMELTPVELRIGKSVKLPATDAEAETPSRET